MKFTDILSMCVRNLTRRKFRTFLTVIGVVIGTCTIVVIISFGIAAGQVTSDLIASWGDLTIIEVFGWDPQAPLDDDAITQMRYIRGVDTVTPFSQFPGRLMLTSGNRDRYIIEWTDFAGVYPDALGKLGYELSEGEFFPPEPDLKKIQVLFGEQAAYQFTDSRRSWPNNTVNAWPDEDGVILPPFVDPLSDSIKLTAAGYDPRGKTLEYEIEVIGILRGDPQRDHRTLYGMFMSIADMRKITDEMNKAQGSAGGRTGSDGYNNVRVKVTDIALVTSVEEAIHELGFPSTHSLENMRKQAMDSIRQTQMIYGGLGVMALIVSAISIANTMVTSVYERTREIGVMKVLGCLVGNIRAVFLVEAGLIGLFGGVIGLVLSFIISFVMNTFSAIFTQGLGNMTGGFYIPPGSQISVIPAWLVLGSLLAATMIGLVSGFMPANRAVKISALEAIKQE
ncbi:MAG: ABC transporter permease [Oscillospiraceae bacterium]|nr:ABC transporter permease [Oscillospiraceae bacterium]